MRRLTSTLELSDSVRDQACQLFCSAQNEDLLRGRSIEAIAAASVYGAYRCNGLSRLLVEVSEMARVEESRVTNAYKTLNEGLGLPTEPLYPSMFVPRLASDLECPNAIRQRARTLAEQAEELGVTTGVHLVVDSTTFYGAVAKGGAAATLVASNETEPAVDDCTLIYDLDETPAPQLTARWPSLPDAVQATSAEGEQLLSAARDQTRWSRHGASEHQQKAPTYLYDECGDGIRDESRLTTVLNDADAMALTETAGERDSDSQRPSVPTTEHLDCQNCGRATDHQFKTHESIPDETWTGQPIWECQVCAVQLATGQLPSSRDTGAS